MVRWNRRTLLKCTAVLGATTVGLATTTRARASPGDQIWAFQTDGEVQSSPTVVGGTVYIGSLDKNLYAVDAASGKQQWAFQTGGRVVSSPTVVAGNVYVGSEDAILYAVDAASGKRQWAFHTNGWVFSSPTVVDGTVYVGTEDGNLYAVEAGVDGSSEGSRVMLGTLGHHGDWRYAGQTIDISTSTQTRSPSRQPTGTAGAGGPGFDVVSALAALGGAGYLLSSRATVTDDD